MSDSTTWMIRAGRGSCYLDAFRDEGIVAIGFTEKGRLAARPTRDELLEICTAQSPQTGEKTLLTWASQIYRFICEVKVGDTVVTYDAQRRQYLLGVVRTEYQHLPQIIEAMPHARKVEWTDRIPRDALLLTTRNTLGAIQSIFVINPGADRDLRKHAVAIDAPDIEIIASTSPLPSPEDDEEQTPAQLREEMVSKAMEFIGDRIGALGWEDMQELVAGVLRAMGYRTTVAPPGADRGCDVFASPDGLGLEDPRIFVEVKHRKTTAMGSKEVRSFLGGRGTGDRCLFVSTGGFTKDALYEADRSTVPLRLLTLTDLADLVVEHYERLDDEARALVPLRKLYWPVS